MTRVVVDAGICGLTTTVEVTKLSNRRAKVVIASGCEVVSEMGGQLQEVDWLDALRSAANSPVYSCAFQHIKHAACPVPSAILKAIEVEVGAALPRDVSIRFETPEPR